MGVSIVCDNYCPVCRHLSTRTTGYACDKYGERVYKSDFEVSKEFERELQVRQKYSKAYYRRQGAY